jgi:hypothetical protein
VTLGKLSLHQNRLARQIATDGRIRSKVPNKSHKHSCVNKNLQIFSPREKKLQICFLNQALDIMTIRSLSDYNMIISKIHSITNQACHRGIPD